MSAPKKKKVTQKKTAPPKAVKVYPVTIPKMIKFIFLTLGNNKKENKTQDPDEIRIHKQWNELGQFKGYWVDVVYTGKKKNLIISFDYTKYYIRILGDVKKIPLFTPGKHNYV